MGCTHWTKQHEVDGTIDKPNQNGFKSVPYATTEFDLSGLESEDEDVNFSFNAIKKNHRQQLTNRFGPPLHGLNSANNTSLTIVNHVLENRVVQTGV
ncbi:unnamed protein product [Rotaria sordida]|uniref:Uncharacterized protein n=1 Tax=Rotaria sordida TaxID=392033 RepID=A0A818R0X1_9BILA|nr:unnamed protein product [Rotaria sordida]CAF0899389.1 unnamed protein product [Rotaria sordida]CAF0905120.1 unnamed protein product [Rotaria sordida]CAF3642616.1 unnamed protein product [Rotaria sordida]CAF3686875.1 unnamed protein product [Rotaria sordida]